MVAEARTKGIDATAETCPHYLYFTNQDIAERGTWVTCSPPVRDAEARAGMRALVSDGAVLTVGSDHGPVDPALKRRGSNNVLDGQPGFPGNETMVPLLLNLAAEGLLSLERLAMLAAEAPARLYGLYPRKGIIAEGTPGIRTICARHRWSLSGETSMRYSRPPMVSSKRWMMASRCSTGLTTGLSGV